MSIENLSSGCRSCARCGCKRLEASIGRSGLVMWQDWRGEGVNSRKVVLDLGY